MQPLSQPAPMRAGDSRVDHRPGSGNCQAGRMPSRTQCVRQPVFRHRPADRRQRQRGEVPSPPQLQPPVSRRQRMRCLHGITERRPPQCRFHPPPGSPPMGPTRQRGLPQQRTPLAIPLECRESINTNRPRPAPAGTGSSQFQVGNPTSRSRRPTPCGTTASIRGSSANPAGVGTGTVTG